MSTLNDTDKAPYGIDPDTVTEWLQVALPVAAPPFKWTLITAGGSNLSYILCDSKKQEWIMRRGPVGKHLSKAHDMQREWSVMSVLYDESSVPVPKCIAYCSDAAVNGADFYIMEFVRGTILRSVKDVAVADIDINNGRDIMESLVAVHANIHKVGIESTALHALSERHNDYVARQLYRWQKQVAIETDAPSLLETLAIKLERLNPGNIAPPSLIHGDYRLDNVVLNGRYTVKAVLDWELSTIGDPVADFFWSLLYWSRKEDDIQVVPNAPTLHEAFPDKEALIACYENCTGFDLSARDYFEAFCYWKMACIIFGVYHRIKKGSVAGMKTTNLEKINMTIEGYLQAANTKILAL